MLSPRANKILEKLFIADDFVSINELADLTNASKRSVRYNLQKIDLFLLKNELPPIERHNRKGAKLNKNQRLNSILQEYLKSQNPYKRILTKKEIQLFVIFNLLIQQKEIPISYFETCLNVSRTSILNNLSELNNYLINKKLKLEWKRWKGIAISGDENVKTFEAANLFCDKCNIADFYKYIELGKLPGGFHGILYRHIFNQKDLQYIKELIFLLESKLGCTFDDRSFIILIFYFTRLINRFDYQTKTSNSSSQNIDFNTPLYELTKKLLKSMQKHYPQIVFDHNETSNLVSLISSLKVVYNQQNFTTEHLKFTDQLISGIESIYQIKFDKYKDELTKMLLQHIKPMMYRIRFQIILENPLFEDIVKKHHELFFNVKKVCDSVFGKYSMSINDHEISYLTIHFASIMEKMEKNTEQPKILVVCIEGVAISKYIATTLQNIFNINEVDTLSIREINDSIIEQYDYVITTLDLPTLSSQKIIKINNLMSREDIKNLKSRMNLVLNKKSENNIAKVEKLINVIKESCEIKDLYKLQYDLLLEILNDEQDFITKPKTFSKFHFNKDLILIEESTLNWKDAILKGANILQAKGYVTVDYGKKIIHNLEQYGPYMSIAPKVVLAHAGPNDGVVSSSMSIVTFKNGVNFYDRFNVPVFLIITLAINDTNNHLDITESIIKLSKNQKLIESIIDSNSNAEIHSIFANNLKI